MLTGAGPAILMLLEMEGGWRRAKAWDRAYDPTLELVGLAVCGLLSFVAALAWRAGGLRELLLRRYG